MALSMEEINDTILLERIALYNRTRGNLQRLIDLRSGRRNIAVTLAYTAACLTSTIRRLVEIHGEENSNLRENFNGEIEEVNELLESYLPEAPLIPSLIPVPEPIPAPSPPPPDSPITSWRTRTLRGVQYTFFGIGAISTTVGIGQLAQGTGTVIWNVALTEGARECLSHGAKNIAIGQVCNTAGNLAGNLANNSDGTNPRRRV